MKSIEITPVAIEATAYRTPITAPVSTSFGTMKDRPCVLVRVVDADGGEGWGEAWCNWPTVAAEYRARLVNETVSPLLSGKTFADPPAAFAEMSRRMEILALQTGEPGPLANAIAGIDMALWDLAARKAGLPLHRALGGEACEAVRAYASGLDPNQPERLALERQNEGHCAFKLKIGFGRQRDLRNIDVLREVLGPDAVIMVDANMAFDLEEAAAMGLAMERFDIAWFEEPLRADRPIDEWRELASKIGIPLAAGENLRDEGLREIIRSGAISVIQPDVAKWGGVSGCLAIGREAVEYGLTYCPHWLAGGVGLLASAHLLAAVGGPGLLEVDANPNPMRTGITEGVVDITDGRMSLPKLAGLGTVPDHPKLANFARPA